MKLVTTIVVLYGLSIALLTTVGTAGATESQSSLQPHLLSLADLPAGWSTDKTLGTSELSTRAPTTGFPGNGCPHHSISPGRGGTTDSVGYQRGPLTVFQESLGTGKPKVAIWHQFNSILSSCTSYRFKTTTGHTTKGSIRSIPFPKIADSSEAFEESISQTGFPARFDIVTFKTGDYVGVILYGGTRTPDIAQLASFTQMAVAKVGAKPSS